MKHIEKERKWLLKRLPQGIDLNNCVYIRQKYVDNYRYRASVPINGKAFYEKIIKTKIKEGVNEEQHFNCSMEEYFDAKGPSIHKKRYFFKLDNGLTAEIDVFIDFALIIMEVENIDIEDEIKFPSFIEDCIIMEVTKFPEFSNKNLAK